ncbi:helix-turn-helix domain-containing protein [Ruania zhangjianzhongii]|uniref:helix-turn-helix domain-containing protein n=1 Tax=Ruania zhangjianzhongii TaxID=2603206 RepID=UPI0011C86580|nr:helix-turn-helix transcriptional regulator [Ruania zhangjianzhongii]
MTRTPRQKLNVSDDRVSMLDELVSTPRGRAELAAAEAALRAQALIEQAFEETALSARDVANALGVTEGRVSQLRHGDGNVRLSTLAKLMSVLDQNLALEAHHTASERGQQVADERDDATSKFWVQRFVGIDGVHEATYEGPSSPTSVTPIGEPEERSRRRDAAWSRYAKHAVAARSQTQQPQRRLAGL